MALKTKNLENLFLATDRQFLKGHYTKFVRLESSGFPVFRKWISCEFSPETSPEMFTFYAD